MNTHSRHCFRPDDIEIVAEHETDDIMETLDVEANWHGRRIGWARSTVKPNHRLLLCDIRIENAYPTPPRPFGWVLHALGLLPRTLDFRGCGVGRRLMAELLEGARRLRIEEVWGSVTEEGAAATPYLLDWYRRCGFQVTDADQECLDVARWKVTLRLGRDSLRNTHIPS